MKRLIFTMAVMTAAFAATADSYFTIGETDTVRLDGTAMGDTVTLPFRCHFDKRVSDWWLELSYPAGMTPVEVAGGPGMTITYLNSEGEECEYTAGIATGEGLTILSSGIMVTGYWPYSSGTSYYAYGPATWPAGDHDDMFYLKVAIPAGFGGGSLGIDGRLTGHAPNDSGIGGVLFYRTVVFTVTLPPGDVDGDGRVTMDDLAEMINVLVTDVQPATESRCAAADISGNGHIDMDDISALINILLNP